jgi:hypothetical protein
MYEGELSYTRKTGLNSEQLWVRGFLHRTRGGSEPVDNRYYFCKALHGQEVNLFVYEKCMKKEEFRSLRERAFCLIG